MQSLVEAMERKKNYQGWNLGKLFVGYTAFLYRHMFNWELCIMLGRYIANNDGGRYPHSWNAIFSLPNSLASIPKSRRLI
ncbi:unnamed protein product [Victoria cruziana]